MALALISSVSKNNTNNIINQLQQLIRISLYSSLLKESTVVIIGNVSSSISILLVENDIQTPI
jgi:hypothetical protein